MDDTDPLRSALALHLGAPAADTLVTRIESYTNLPNAIKGAARMDPSPEIEAAALRAVEDPSLTEVLGLDGAEAGSFGFGPSQEGWALLTLAARADVAVLDRVADQIAGDSAPRHLTAIRRATAKHASAATATGSTRPAGDTGPDVPQKVSQVKRWLADHPDIDPVVLAPRPGQKAPARVSAIRALGAIGTPAALAVLGQYAEDSYPVAVLAELHKAWGRFDRREFAATMFRPARYTLDLGLGPSIEGIGAVAGLTSLDVVLTDGADLAPLTECAGLRTLRVGAEGLPGFVDVTPIVTLGELTELHLTRTTRNADLTVLADLGVQRLRIDLDGADGSFLLSMTSLSRVMISGGTGPDDLTAATDDDTPPIPPHPGLGDVVLQLVRKGVEVIVHKHEKAWVSPLLAAVDAAGDVFAVERGGRIGLTATESALEQLDKRLFSNLVP